MINTRKIALSAVMGALYFVLTISFAPIAYGPVQFRISECLTILPLIFPESAVGLIVGCFLANIFGNGAPDIVFGTLATAFASVLTIFAKKAKNKHLRFILGAIPPILVNAIIVPFTFLMGSFTLQAYLFGVLTVGAGQLTVIAILGSLVYYSCDKIFLKDK